MRVLFLDLWRVPRERQVEIPLEFGTTIAQLIERLGLDDFVSGGLRVAIDGYLVNEFDSPIKDSSELAFLPPFQADKTVVIRSIQPLCPLAGYDSNGTGYR